MDESFSTCSFCGEELTNFTLRLLPARKMPKKSLKLYHNPSRQREASSTFNPDQSSFISYIHRLSIPTNVVNIKCGSCKTSDSKMALKPLYVPPVQPPSSNSTPDNAVRRTKKKKRPTQEMNAGLIIPASMRSNPVAPISIPGVSQPPSKSTQSVLFTNHKVTANPSVKLTEDDDQVHMSRRRVYNAMKKDFQHGKKKKKQEILQLQKVLSRSKEMKNSGSSCLGSFLGQ